jgi:uncharacterized protein with von Willebrand factor type A (vWA) domain
MAKNTGYIRLYRSILDSAEWTLPDNQKVVMMAILLSANYKPSTVFLEGNTRTIEPGQLLTSYEELKKQTGASIKTIRSSVSNLIKTGFLAKEVTKGNHTIISINNWEKYQADKAPANESANESANEGQTKGKASAESEEGKKGKEGKKLKNNTLSVENEIYDYYKANVKAGDPHDAKKSITKLLTKEGRTPEELKTTIDNYVKSTCFSQEVKYRIQANNFFGEKRRFEEFLNGPVITQSTPVEKPKPLYPVVTFD